MHASSSNCSDSFDWQCGEVKTDRNQTLVRWSVSRNASLQAPGCSEGNNHAQQRHGAVNVPKMFLERVFKGKVREGRCRVHDQLVHSSLIG